MRTLADEKRDHQDAQRLPLGSKASGPIATWDDDHASDPRLVWWSRLDRRYLVEVVRCPGTGDSATLRVFDHERADRALLSEPVSLAFGARFGPDVADVAAWQCRAIEVVDG